MRTLAIQSGFFFAFLLHNHFFPLPTPREAEGIILSLHPMNIVLFDDPAIRTNLLPLTFTRPVANIRVGILTIAEKWEKRLSANISFLTEPYLQKKFPANPGKDNLFINGAWCPDAPALLSLKSLKPNEVLVHNNFILAWRSEEMALPDLKKNIPRIFTESVTLINQRRLCPD